MTPSARQWVFPLKRFAMSTSRARANAIRALAMDAVQAAKSGHPGAPMGMADMAEVLWGQFLKHKPVSVPPIGIARVML